MSRDPREPATVRIGPFDYEIRWMDRIEASDSSAFGLHNGNDHCIRLERSRRRHMCAFHRDNPDAMEWWYRLLLVDPMKEYE
jgi:hypothetical protein